MRCFRYYAVLAAVTLTGFVTSGCSDDKVSDPPAVGVRVFGSVSTGEQGIVVSLWQAEQLHRTETAANGAFSMELVRPGQYIFRAEEGEDLRREWNSISVGDMELNLGEVRISDDLPDPFLEAFPVGDNTDTAINRFAVFLLTYRPFSLESFSQGVDIQPPLSGEWEENSSTRDGIFSLTLRPEPAPWPETTYQVTIDSDIQLQSGEPWGSTLSYSFTTEPFAIDEWFWGDDVEDGILSPSHRGIVASAIFTNDVDEASISEGVVIEPNVAISVNLSGKRFLVIETKGRPFSPDTEYRLTINQQVRSPSGVPLEDPLVLNLRTTSGG